MIHSYLDFEKSIADIEGKIEELKAVVSQGEAVAVDDEIARLQEKAKSSLADLYAKLTPWQKTMVARHPGRPHFLDYIEAMIEEFTPLGGDRLFGEDPALIAGFGRFKGEPVALIGHEKGHDTQSRVHHNFGSARPEGYRKAVRIMNLANAYGLPVLAFVDTAGAYPGVGAEERGQAEAIARATQCCLNLKVPNVAIIIGEGGSGGAVAIATASKVLMLEHAIYTVASPEACASILWRDTARAEDAATNMKITSADLLRFGVVDAVIPEPAGGAHRHPQQVMQATAEMIAKALQELQELDPAAQLTLRRDKFMAISATH